MGGARTDHILFSQTRDYHTFSAFSLAPPSVRSPLIEKVGFYLKYAVGKERQCSGESEILHELVHDMYYAN